ncbi:unnamed protein product [Haemonchus placei]|uniref:RING-type E3 ubiquitin transferase n=1 Tax=Haemonchus placei TaxID=6290 RepID=A0A3P7U6F4_HAEPC|nr:unnamed protein product [Haemonchus placei]
MQVRTPHKSLADNTELRLRAGTLSTELTHDSNLPIQECLHRFCAECITTALFRGNKECPTCRKKLVSKRSLRPDPNFDSLIAKVTLNSFHNQRFNRQKFLENTASAFLQQSCGILPLPDISYKLRQHRFAMVFFRYGQTEKHTKTSNQLLRKNLPLKPIWTLCAVQ